jgi:hypothetical protein
MVRIRAICEPHVARLRMPVRARMTPAAGEADRRLGVTTTNPPSETNTRVLDKNLF